jgi:hypothetical protein
MAAESVTVVVTRGDDDKWEAAATDTATPQIGDGNDTGTAPSVNPDNLSDPTTPEGAAVQKAVLAALEKYDSDRFVKAAVGTIMYSGTGALNDFTFPESTPGSGSIVALGRNAMASVTDSVDGIAIGNRAMSEGKSTRDNIAIGGSALRVVEADSTAYDQSAKNGTRNIAIGGNAHYFLTKGWGCVSIGRNAGSNLVAGNGLTAIGGGAAGGYAPIGLSGQIENWTPWGATTDSINTTAVGSGAAGMVQATDVVAVGGNALRYNKKSDQNTAVGAKALNQLDVATGYTGGVRSTLNISGTYTQTGSTLTVTAQNHGLLAGDVVVLRLLDGPAQTFQQDQVPATVASVTNANTFVITSPKLVTGSGSAQLYGRETAAQASRNEGNTALGFAAGIAMQTGNTSTYVGANAGSSFTNATQTAAVGASAFRSATSASNSTAVGFFAAGNMSGDATQVTAIGASALRNKVDGTPLTEPFQNIVGIGYDSRVSGPNQVQLGNTSQTVYAQSAVQTRSDERDKAEIRDTKLGLEFIQALRPVDFKWDRREDYTEYDEDGNGVGVRERDGSQRGTRYHHGFVAQEVGKVIDELGVDFGGYQDHTDNGGDDVQSIGYEEVIAPLVRAVQELSTQVEQLKTRLGD